MAVLGDQLNNPESGWQRYDDTNDMIVYTGTWLTETLAGNYNGSAKYTSTSGSTMSFTFYGTKIRIIGGLYSGRTTTAQVVIDGINLGIINEDSTTSRTKALVFEKIDLSQDKHVVQIKTVDSKTLILDAIDVGEDGYMTRSIGVVLTAPDVGWKRYDDTESSISYTGFTQRNYAVTGAYEGKSSYNADASTVGEVVFSFVGTKVRIISSSTNTSRAQSVSISIDGHIETLTPRTSVIQAQTLVYEKIGLPYGTHTIKIFNFKGVTAGAAGFGLDAIDIDSDGHLVRYIGSEVTVPEIGWKRYDADSLEHSGTDWKTVENTTGRVFEGGSVMYSNVIGNYIKFSFTGKKLRLVAEYGSLYDPDVEVSIDGVVEYINLSTTSSSYQPQRIVLEKTNLSEGSHEVVVKKVSGTGNFHIDAVDVDVNGYIVRPIGSQLTTPDAGWKRYDNSSAMKYEGLGWVSATGDPNTYAGTAHYISLNGASSNSIKFNFYGTKLRIIDLYWTNRVDNVTIEIDGKVSTWNPNNPANKYQILVFEVSGLEKGLHEVKLSTTSLSGTFSLDAVDIDLDGRMFHPDEVTSIAELEVGKRIRCHYIAARNSAGVFSKLGEETFDFIGSSGSPIPMGDFYWIMVEDWNKRKFLVADRNIQNAISWDSINKEGYIFGVESTTIFKTYNKTPQITSASDVYSVTGIGTSLTNEDPWRAFSSNGWWGSYAGTGLILDCKRRVKFGEIKVTAYYGANMASVIDVYGSDNNSDFTLIKSCQKSTWSNLEQATFYFDQPAEYRYYKIMKTTQTSGSNAARLKFELSYSEKIDNNHIFKLRLLTGGINSSDKDNEWDMYIVNSTLNGKIIAGDNNVWNWIGIASLSSTSNTSTNRAQRGNSISGYGTVATTLTNVTSGFRPLLEVEILPMDRSFINHKGSYKKYVPIEFIESNDNAIPVMTSNITPSGIASASSINSTSFDAYQAFNGIQDERYGWASLTPVSWLQYQFPTKKIIYKYSLAMRTNGSYYATGEPPKSWTFEGSNDGINWSVLDTQINNATLVRGSIEEYRINNSDVYTYYRVNVSANQGNETITVIAELKMFEKTPKGEVIGWNTISATLPSENTFINDGMDNLSVLDRKNENFVQNINADGSLGSGKLFKGSIDLIKYFEISNVSMK
ncbi:hypothetical protein [Paenibacillus sp. FSL R5-0519]|uniref:hypothetical protein n=1 Tax=Paenibacillus sp. FSL R5-0519 TaxID=2921648 RepID=UPI0030DD502A